MNNLDNELLYIFDKSIVGYSLNKNGDLLERPSITTSDLNNLFFDISEWTKEKIKEYVNKIYINEHLVLGQDILQEIPINPAAKNAFIDNIKDRYLILDNRFEEILKELED